MDEYALQEIVTASILDALAIGVIVTDEEARRIYANAAAARLLAKGRGPLRLCSGKIGAANGKAQRDLQAMIVRVCSPAARPLAGNHYLLVPSEEDASADLAVCVAPVDSTEPGRSAPNAMLLVREIERDCNVEIEGRRLFGLTKAEAKFASSLASGLSLGEAAQTHAVTLSTARTHIKSIYRKTGACRQSQVAALLRGSQIPVRLR